MNPGQLMALGNRVTKFERFDLVSAPSFLSEVRLICTEVTSNCPVTGQPDFYEVVIVYVPDEFCVESKTLKLYLQGFRDKGLFGEAFSSQIVEDLLAALDPISIEVTVTQTPRGGISIVSTSSYNRAGGGF